MTRCKYRPFPILGRLGFDFYGTARLFTVPVYHTYRTSLVWSDLTGYNKSMRNAHWLPYWAQKPNSNIMIFYNIFSFTLVIELSPMYNFVMTFEIRYCNANSYVDWNSTRIFSSISRRYYFFYGQLKPDGPNPIQIVYLQDRVLRKIFASPENYRKHQFYS